MSDTLRSIACSLIFVGALLVSRARSEDVRYAIAIHGGAGSAPQNMSEEQRAGRRASMEAVLTLGNKMLAEGGTSLDAVEAVIRQLEDDPLFNAGRGAVLDATGGIALDASIMDGRDRSCGAVGDVRGVRHPITLARRVMTDTRHILLVSAGAKDFARQHALELVEQDYFRTPHQVEAYQKWRERQQGDRKTDGAAEQPEGDGQYATVGCVALDRHGNLAAGTSTGGLRGKMFGRVGDSPLIAAGTYADNATCAVSGTGIGEQFIRHAVAYDIAAQMRYRSVSLADAVDQTLTKTLRPGDGGVIAVDRDGQIVMRFTTGGMPRAAADSIGRFEVQLGK